MKTCLVSFSIILMCCVAAHCQLSSFTDSTQLVEQANSLLKEGKLDEAQHAAQQAIDASPSNYIAYAVAAKIASKRGDIDSTKKSLDKALSLAPDNEKAKIRQLTILINSANASRQAAPARLSGEGRAGDYEALIDQARPQALAEQFQDCLSNAQTAISQNPQDYEGYFYASLALYRQDKLDDAQPFLHQAKAKVGSDNAAAVAKLEQAIGYRRTALVEIKRGDAAMDDGLPGKAAAAYRRAWESGQMNPAIGVKAASLYADRLEDPMGAARILRQIVEKYPNGQASEDAAQQLAKLGQILSTLARNLYSQASSAKGEHAAELLHEAIEADPNLPGPHRGLAALSAITNDTNTMYLELKELSKLGILSIDDVLRGPGGDPPNSAYEKYYADPLFQQFVLDALGPKAADAVTSYLKTHPPQAEIERLYAIAKMKMNQALDDAAGKWELDGDSSKGILTIKRASDGTKLICSGRISYQYNKDHQRETLNVTGSSYPRLYRGATETTIDELIFNGEGYRLESPQYKVELSGNFQLSIGNVNSVLLDLCTERCEKLSIECGTPTDTEHLFLRRHID